jgi:hypothetical protein
VRFHRKLVRRILTTIGIAVVAIVVLFDFILPAGLCFYLRRTAPAYVYAVPRDLQDLSVSQAPGTKMLYFGYEFEVPWGDVGEAERKPFASKNLAWDTACVSFRSGLKLLVTTAPADAASPNYVLAKLIYEFDPHTMRIWPPSPGAEYRRIELFMEKSALLSNPLSAQAASGIFSLESNGYKGFQLGNPQLRPDRLRVQLYSDEGSFDITFLQAGYEEPSGVTQPEVNRIVQSLHRRASSPVAQIEQPTAK